MSDKYKIYIALFLMICLIPSSGLPFSGVEESSENREAAPSPELVQEGKLNPYFLSDAGKWFEDHFAFRNEWVTAYALLAGKGFGVSAQERVITGKDGWLFYKDSLADFQGTEQMTDRQLFDTAHSLAMVQEYVNSQGADFLFAAAPNKNSLYGEYMPYYYQPFRRQQGNMERFMDYLEEEQVNYVDLYEVLKNQERIVYHKRDSHWNNEGAAAAADAVLAKLGKEHVSYSDRDCEVRRDFIGDLDTMLYPAAAALEEEIYYEPMPQYTYRGEVKSNFDPKIHTSSKGQGSLVMYRDSFGNALLPFFAEAFENAYFSRALPYYLPDVEQERADTVVIERAERFLPDMAKEAPYMEAPEIKKALQSDPIPIEDLEIAAQGAMTKITGRVPEEALTERSRIYIMVNGDVCYEAFPISRADGREGFSMLLASERLQGKEDQFAMFLEE